MPVKISYMGTKRQLAPLISEIISLSRPGPLLDAFSGICAISNHILEGRQQWTNDLQVFSHTVAKCYFCSSSPPLGRLDLLALTQKAISRHFETASKQLSVDLHDESIALKSNDFIELQSLRSRWEHKSSRVQKLCRHSNGRLFSRLYAGSYFGLTQTLEIDGIQTSLSSCLKAGLITEEQRDWAVLALAVAINQCASVTGHFAQALTPKQRNIKRVVKQRQKSIKAHWLAAIETMQPHGSLSWRKKNRAFCGDALDVISELSTDNHSGPAVIYADPPYTSDQYSRYYHVYETLILYDNVVAEGRGRYRPDRKISDFCLASRVSDSFEQLVKGASSIGADLVISYPNNGILGHSTQVIPDIIKKHYNSYPDITKVAHQHSTMGGSKGRGKTPVVEVIYKATSS